MAHHTVETLWSRGEQAFLDNRYSRRHILRLDAGLDIPGSSSPHVVPVPYSDPGAIDPEEGFDEDDVDTLFVRNPARAFAFDRARQ